MSYHENDRSESDRFEKFNFFVLPNNTNGAVNIPISSNAASPTILASLAIYADRDDVLWLTASVGWRADTGVVNVLFRIWRNAPVTGILIASALQGGDSNSEINYVTSFSHVDANFTHSRERLYFLTAEVTNAPNTATVRGPITFTATEIDSE